MFTKNSWINWSYIFEVIRRIAHFNVLNVSKTTKMRRLLVLTCLFTAAKGKRKIILVQKWISKFMNNDTYDKYFDNQKYFFNFRPHLCSECGVGFMKADHLRRHINSTHLKIKNIKCSFCDKMFSDKYKCKVRFSKSFKFYHQKSIKFSTSRIV